jgi:hypothetical protein
MSSDVDPDLVLQAFLDLFIDQGGDLIPAGDPAIKERCGLFPPLGLPAFSWISLLVLLHESARFDFKKTPKPTQQFDLEVKKDRPQE